MSPEERRAWVERRSVDKTRAADRARYQRDRTKRLAAHRDQVARNPAPSRAAKARWSERNPEKRRAHHAVSNAVRDGKLIKGPCELADEGGCRGRIQAHHDDYSKPLDVRWLCTGHHAAHHHQND